MRVSWTLFLVLTALLWFLWPRLPLLSGISECVGTLLLVTCASYFLAKWLWGLVCVRQISGDGKAVLITGCDSGFGHLLAKCLARDGFLVFAGCLDAKSEGALSLKNLKRIKVLQMDVTKDADIDNTHRIVKEELGTHQLWAVVCNAGMMNNGLIEWMTMDSIKRIFDVNVFGVVRVVKRFLHMLRESRGRVVIVTSGHSYFTLPFITPYAMTKHAVISLVDGLRRECYEKSVDVVAVEPLLYRSRVTEAVGCVSAVEKELKSQPSEVTANYSQQEIRDWAQSVNALYNWRIKDDIQEIVDQMVLAVRETDPKSRYRTMSLFDYVWVGGLRALPAEAADIILFWLRKMLVWKK
ncbi:retinol dehydrogenase 7-like isoform X2 [Amblyomma americanum]